MELQNVHAGEVLKEEFLDPLGITVYRLAKEIKVPETRIKAIVDQERSITPDTAIRLGRYFSNSAQFWLNLQNAYDLENKKQNLNVILDSINPFRASV